VGSEKQAANKTQKLNNKKANSKLMNWLFKWVIKQVA
jgi:hypothetical protein